MDITKSENKSFTTKFINGETINYSAMFMLTAFAFIVVKQILKLGFAVSSSIAVLISFTISLVALFFLEKKFVFTKGASKNTAKQIIMYFLSSIVCYGFYEFLDLFFVSILKLEKSNVYFASAVLIFFFKYYFDRLLVFEASSNAEDYKNGRLYDLFFRNRFVLLSMGIATLGILFVYLVFELYPFGDMTVLRMDLYHQYGPLFAELYDRVIEHKSFIYSWESGGGASFLGNYFNYLSSPLSALIFLFDRKQIAYAITTLVVVKGVLASGTFTLYIKHSLKSHCYASASFGVLYAFSSYFLAYYWNIMWLDGMILLPIIMLGIERIIDKGKPTLYIASLALMFYANYYISYMVCIFSIIYFLFYFFSNYNGASAKKDKKESLITKLKTNKFVTSGLTFAGASLICAVLCAVFLIPVYFILQQCSATSDSFPAVSENYFNLFNLISSHIAGLETTIRSSGDDVLPNVYCGMLTVILIPLYFMNKEIRLKEKLLYVLLLVFFVFSFNNNYVNFVWHAFHFPNDLPYRFSFMYSFVLLGMAYRALMKIRVIRYQDVAVIGIIWALLILYFEANPTNKINDLSIYISLALIIAWTGFLLMLKKGILKKSIIGISIIALTFCEVIVSDSNSYSFTQHNTPYFASYDDYEDAIDKVYTKDKDFYRTELCYLNTRMDPCLYGYNGISTFSSMAYEKYSRTQYSLGMFGNRINSHTYNNQTPVYNMMFAIKYIMYKDTGSVPSKNFYSKYYSTDNYNVEVYQNDYHLPIAYEVSSDIKDWVVEEGNPFEVQEDFIDSATGVRDVFVEADYNSTRSENIESDEVISNGTYNFYKDSTDVDYATLTMSISPRKDGNLFVYITSPTIKNVNYTWGEDESLNQNIDEPYIMDLGSHKQGEEVEIELDCAEINDGSYFDIYAYTVDEDVFSSAYDLLNAGAINITDYSDTKIEGTISAGYNGYLYTSIPYDDGWSVYIDGKKQETFEVGNAMLVTKLKSGKHKVVMKYTPKGANYGIAITLAGWCCIIAYLIIKIIFGKRKKSERFVEHS